MAKRPTIEDIARLVGVSRTTISRVLNHQPDVDRATRERVLRIIDEQGYVPSLTAAGLAGGRNRLLELACRMDSLPSSYFQYYYFKDEILAELQQKPTTRAQDIIASVPDYWAHYREQAERDKPELDRSRSRGGIHELELSIDMMDAIYNDRNEVWYVNVPNHGSLPDFPDDMVVETVGFVDRNGIAPLAMGHPPRHVVGLVKMLGEYQALTAEAAWSGSRIDAIRVLASHPLVFSLHKAEAIYADMPAVLLSHRVDQVGGRDGDR